GIFHQLLCGDGGPWQNLDESHNLLVAGDGTANHRGLHHHLVRIENRLDLGRIHIETRADDQLLSPPDDEEELAVGPSEAAGVEPAVAIDRLGRELRCSIIAEHHIRAAHVQFADLAVWNRRALEVDQTILDSRQKLSYGVIVARPLGAYAGE